MNEYRNRLTRGLAYSTMKAETYCVETFTEVYSSRGEEREKSVRENLRTRIRAAGLDPEKGETSIHWHPDQKVFIMVITVIRVNRENQT